MQRLQLSRRIVLTFAPIAAIGCSSLTTIGVSGNASDGGPVEPAPSASPDPSPGPAAPTAIVAARGEALHMVKPQLGDVDGDGRADFVLRASSASIAELTPRSYLFYGKPDFPANLTATDADTVFEDSAWDSGALGDINGDGLADFTIGSATGHDLVFGSRERRQGLQTAQSSDVRWTTPAADGVEWIGLSRLGDIDGDGCSELVARFAAPVPESELAHRAEPLWTDYVIAGQRDGWFSGTWDASWAVAQLGDEPPSIEDGGLTTVLHRLTVIGGGDFDGDGYADILARGRWSVWVFYGRAEGLHDTLTPEHADAELNWENADHNQLTLAKTSPFVVGDVDGDGSSDLALPSSRELGIVYGTSARWSGRVMLEPALTVVGDGALQTATGDFDGDGQPELLVLTSPAAEPGTGLPSPTAESRLYAIGGSASRATGRHQLQDSDRYRLAGDPAPVLDAYGRLQLGGDIDGDGSSDLLIGAPERPVSDEASGVVYIVPGTTLAPD